MKLPEGIYQARAVPGTANLGLTGELGADDRMPQIAVKLVITQGNCQGSTITWYGLGTA